ncbi:MAG: beta-ketoacyl-[acyl-carrier-protein] synthase II [Chlamydiae bacterium GWC2_50_10]|nr:MAG: beta-ketoacyl-[acyl-carrier-protein] synthase II [Chlamydiae bacterium GWA2_50_15]OGN53900.1 MAG: beta-ketoacyl-[acyl-carrier-protein] synthase II [Chlamydiae bacterium GWC2_50_10]OGN57164.1 MAG: beta-ketoacyl-[acyl-carrier-protein] synthase II [Chlamydiae bacterium RIFCSPHIGHO2_02_FULL_49_29]OGN62666.1 MAG: beta-ketoacyl-[acyl-carrier-protein] synthase II [Chlamydiae bacterium RIFCSPHIGHO2_12_FULL_49_32]OGN71920.1 MAG: beta-ketoacyl-[acyl-carrier-protein] synthase II [Chlamydiae bacter
MRRKDKKRRVVVTGMGIVSCFGDDVDLFYEKLLLGTSGIGPIESFSVEEYPTRFAGSVSCFDPGEYIDKKQARRLDPFLQYGIVSGKRALESAHVALTDLSCLDKSRCGILLSSGMGGLHVLWEGTRTIINKGYKRLTPFFIPYIIPNMGGALLAIDLGFQGPVYSISTACATSNYAILSAANHIERGDADLMLCGGAEAAINPIGLSGFVAVKALSERNDAPEKASRPWDKNRDGFVLGEGAGMLVLESYEHASKRGAPILAEFLGGALSCDAHHITEPDPSGRGVKLCMEKALEDAGVRKEEIDYINAHATSTLVGDMCEVRAIKDLFQGHCSHLKMNATKSLIGHSLGAASAIEAIVTIKALLSGKLHPTLNLDDPEPELEGLDAVPHKAKEHRVQVAMTNSFGFGGHNSSLIFAQFKD